VKVVSTPRPLIMLHSQTTRLVEGALHSAGWWPRTGFSHSVTSCSKELRPQPLPKHPLQITTRTLKEPDFKFELLPLHSPLLGQSLLVSFPPLIDMLKFSGYPYRGLQTPSTDRFVGFSYPHLPPAATSGVRTA